MKDVATFCRWKFLVEAAVRIPIGILVLAVAAFTPIMVQEEVRAGHASPAVMVMGLFPLLIGYAAFASGVRRLLAACRRGWWFRAGREGLSFFLPYKANWRAGFLVSFDRRESFPWSEVRRFYTLQYKLNGIPFGRALVVETNKGRFNFGGYFVQSAEGIAAFIAEEKARSGVQSV